MMELLFYLSLIGVSYSYFIYPLILLTIRERWGNHSSEQGQESPRITFIITVHNEESSIEEKLINTLELRYPDELLEILVASDGSTDNTNAIVLGYQDKGVRLIDVTEHKGKEFAQLQATLQAAGDIVVFSDVATRIERDALNLISDIFRAPDIGAVSSEDRFLTDEGEIAGEGAYVKYEMWLRNLESSAKGLVGLSGSFFAARKEVCENYDSAVPSDFNTALTCIQKGYRAISDSRLVGYYPNLVDESKEYARKVRTVVGGMSALKAKKEVLNPFKYGFFAFQVFSHKLMRWLVPWFMLLALVTNILLLDIPAFQVIFSLQVVFYVIVLLGYIVPTLKQNPVIKIPCFFVQVNMAIMHSAILFLAGKRFAKWEPSKR